jgi:hypothetical protein
MIEVPAVTPEQLYKQDARRRKWDKEEGRVILHTASVGAFETGWYAATNPPEKARDEREQTMGALWGERLLL